jgi:hypothetical protein
MLISMSTRLQVIMDDEELDEIRAIAKRKRMTVAEWVRQALRAARSEEPVGETRAKLAAVAAASMHRYPAGAIDDMLAEIVDGRDAGRP